MFFGEPPGQQQKAETTIDVGHDGSVGRGLAQENEQSQIDDLRQRKRVIENQATNSRKWDESDLESLQQKITEASLIDYDDWIDDEENDDGNNDAKFQKEPIQVSMPKDDTKNKSFWRNFVRSKDGDEEKAPANRPPEYSAGEFPRRYAPGTDPTKLNEAEVHWFRAFMRNQLDATDEEITPIAGTCEDSVDGFVQRKLDADTFSFLVSAPVCSSPFLTGALILCEL